jgi:hypothetical protein
METINNLLNLKDRWTIETKDDVSKHSLFGVSKCHYLQLTATNYKSVSSFEINHQKMTTQVLRLF